MNEFFENNKEPEYSEAFNHIDLPEVKEPTNYKQNVKGLKIFALILAFVILLTASCAAGYFLGAANNENVLLGGNIKVDLAAKPVDTNEMTAAQVYSKVNPSVVGIVIYNKEGKMAQASGVIYTESGMVITNDHIYSEIRSPLFKIYTSDGKEYNAEFVAGDIVSDLAVLKITGGDSFVPAVLGNSNELLNGENVVAIGRPSEPKNNSSITKGIISATSRRLTTTSSYSARLIQTDSAINPGSSGGALVNMYGQVVGITSSKLANAEYDTVGFAIPTTTVKRIVDELISKGKVVSRAKLGITYTEMDSVTAEINGHTTVGLLVNSVAEDSDLYEKINKNDVITSINGQKITSDDMVLDIIESSSAGDTIIVEVVSPSGKTNTYKAELRANISESSYKR